MRRVGYCTNVHPGRNLQELRDSLLGPAAEVAQLVNDGPLPIGVWLSAESVRQLQESPDQARRLRDDALAAGLRMVAVNAFPYGNFGAERVKTLVYEPHWGNARRALYTLAVAELLPDLLAPDVRHASISTLPLGWRPRFSAEGCGASVGLAAAQLEQLARGLARIEQRTGVHLTLDIEPEPGCAIQTFDELTGFMTHCLQPRSGDTALHRHLGACVDVCHGAVMGEAPDTAFDRCEAAGIGVHRVQVSSALAGDATPEHLQALRRFDEPRYLHQVVTGTPDEPRVWEDIPNFLAGGDGRSWRCHFHVPIFLTQVSVLRTTHQAIPIALQRAARLPEAFIEVETYAWAQLPEPAAPSVPEGIAQEIRHARTLLAKVADSAQPATR